MKTTLPLIFALFLSAAGRTAAQTETHSPPALPELPTVESNCTQRVYVIPVQQEVAQPLLYVIRRGIQEAERDGADAIVLHMDTLGGAVFVTEEIFKNLSGVDIPTYTFVEKEAISAGAMIALATDYIYMRPGSKIGDAIPVIMSSGGGGYETQGSAEREKIESFVDGMMRSMVQQKGRDEQYEMIARCMVRKDLEFKIGEDIISEKGQILVLTDREAALEYGEPPAPLLSQATVDTLDEMLVHAGFANAEIVTLEITWADKLARLLVLMAPLLMTLGGLCIYIEIQNPGIGLAGATAVLCFLVFFFGHNVAGLAGMEELLLFALGIGLLIVEIFVLPGFGIAGFAGLVLVLGALFSAMVQRYPGVGDGDWLPGWDAFSNPEGALVNLSGAIIATGAGALLAGKYLPQSRLFQSRLVLQEATSRDAGYTSASDQPNLLGHSGTALTDLRPGGSARFDRGGPVDVITEGGFIEQGARVLVTEIHGSRVVVIPAPAAAPEEPAKENNA